MIPKPIACLQSGRLPLTVRGLAVAVACVWFASAACATEAEDYRRRAAQRDVAMFDAEDRDKDGRLTIEEARGNIDLEARFNDIDINRDGVMTREELLRYVALRYGDAYVPK